MYKHITYNWALSLYVIELVSECARGRVGLLIEILCVSQLGKKPVTNTFIIKKQHVTEHVI